MHRCGICCKEQGHSGTLDLQWVAAGAVAGPFLCSHSGDEKEKTRGGLGGGWEGGAGRDVNGKVESSASSTRGAECVPWINVHCKALSKYLPKGRCQRLNGGTPASVC